MPKYKMARRPPPIRRRRYRRKAAAKPSVTKLARAVTSLQRANKREAVWNQLTRTYNANVQSDYMYYELDRFNAMTLQFGTSTNDYHSNKVVNYSDLLRVNVNLANGGVTETGRIQFYCALVSLKDEIGSAFNPATGALTLTSGTHYWQSQGLFVLNPKCFKLHAAKRFVLDNQGISLATSTAQTQYGTDMNFDMFLKRNAMIQTTGTDWGLMQCPPDPSKNAFLIIFNDNSALDVEYPALNIAHKKVTKTL